MAYISRSEWGARAPKSRLVRWPAGQPTSWTLHYEGKDVPTNRDRAYYDAHIRAIQRWQMDVSSEGYWDIAYNFIVSPIGDIYEGRGWSFKSGAQRDGNSSSVAAMYMGGLRTNFTDLAQNATKWLIAQKPMDVHPHSFWVKTPCPGPYVKAWINLGQPAGKECRCPPKPKPQRASFRIGPTLQRGNEGVSVKTLQRRLNLATGAGLKVDGDFGGLTYRAVKNFQHFFKLTVDGIVGPKTWGALNYFYALKGGR